MTLSEAASLLGYIDSSALRHAVRRGILRTKLIEIGPVKMHVTTRAWLDEYVAHVKAHQGGRGKKRGPRRPQDPPA